MVGEFLREVRVARMLRKKIFRSLMFCPEGGERETSLFLYLGNLKKFTTQLSECSLSVLLGSRVVTKFGRRSVLWAASLRISFFGGEDSGDCPTSNSQKG